MLRFANTLLKSKCVPINIIIAPGLTWTNNCIFINLYVNKDS